MQLLTPQGQPTGQIQYIQFLQPVVVPFKNYLQSAMTQGVYPNIAQPQPQIQITSASAAVAQQYKPTSTQTPPNTGYYPYAQQQQPIAAFSTPIASFYHPNIYSTSRIQLLSGPGDLNLNTNEYLPAASEMSFSAVKPVLP